MFPKIGVPQNGWFISERAFHQVVHFFPPNPTPKKTNHDSVFRLNHRTVLETFKLPELSSSTKISGDDDDDDDDDETMHVWISKPAIFYFWKWFVQFLKKPKNKKPTAIFENKAHS